MEDVAVFQIIFVSIFVICMILGIITLPLGMILFYIFKKPIGQKLGIFGAFCATLGFMSMLIAVKAFKEVLLILFFIFIINLIFKKIKGKSKNKTRPVQKI